MSEPETTQDLVAAALFIRLYTDEMVPAWFAPALRDSSYDAVSAYEAAMIGASD